MNKAPSLFSIPRHLTVASGWASYESSDGKTWQPLRPLGFFGLLNRLKLAWGVFVGKYDAVQWPGQQ